MAIRRHRKASGLKTLGNIRNCFGFEDGSSLFNAIPSNARTRTNFSLRSKNPKIDFFYLNLFLTY